MQPAPDPHQHPAVRPRRRHGKGKFVFALLVLVLAGGIIYPPTYLFGVKQALRLEALRYGFHLSIRRLDGSVTDPLWLYGARLSHNSDAGTWTQLEVEKAHTRLDWKHLFWHRDARVWDELTLDGVRGTVDLPARNQRPKGHASPFRLLAANKLPRLVLPSSLKISRASVVIRQAGGEVRLTDVDLQASDLETGHLVIGAVSIQEPWMTSVFSNCQGALLLQDTKLVLTGMKLSDSLSITSASTDLPGLLRGQLQMEFALDAFTGSIQGELKSGAHQEHLAFESSGTFSNISVKQLAAFLGQDAEGSIKNGNFTFRGSPRALEKATFTARFEAGAFRWGPRRWNSLVAGVTYVDRRLEVHDFELRQAHNSLALTGDMDVPAKWNEWWTTDFSFHVAARIDDLSALSALLGPDFGNIFGKLTVDGSVSGEKASFEGQLLVSGSHLSYKNAPLDVLHAGIRLQGNEVQVENAEFTHGDDYLRAHGVVNILGKKRYSGQVKASVADLALYASFLQPPIAPEAFGGGLKLDWSGDGAQSAHSGAFTVGLAKVHPLVSGTGVAAWNPIDLNAKGTYSPESIFFSNLVLGDGATTLASQVVATPKSLTLQGIKLQHGKAAWLTGDAQIPLNVWAAWQNPATAEWWNFDSPCKLNVGINRLSVQDTLLLSGRALPFAGEVTGSLKTEGTLAKLAANGALTIKNGSGTTTAGTLKGGNVALSFAGSEMTIQLGTGNWNGVGWTADGSVAASDLRKPVFTVGVKVPSAPFDLSPGVHAAAGLDLRVEGAPAEPLVTGSARLLTLDVNRSASIESLVANGGTGLRGPLATVTIPGPANWKLGIVVGGTAAMELSNATGTIIPAVSLSESLGQPKIAGNVDVKGFTLSEGPDTVTVKDGTFFLNPADIAATGVVLHASGVAGGEDFDGYIYGTLGEKWFTWGSETTAALAGDAGVLPMAERSTAPLTLGLGIEPTGTPPAARP